MSASLLNDLNFVAIDFETANSKRSSVCAVALVKVKNGAIVEKKDWLVHPPTLDFTPINISIHGITAERVKNEPTFDIIWKEMEPLLQNETILAHNASFDIHVLKSILFEYQIEAPELDYFCSIELAKVAWPDLESYKLNVIAESLNIKLDHHQAISDASACAQIAIQACEKTQSPSLHNFPTVSPKRIEKFSAQLKEHLFSGPLDSISFRNKLILFTGEMTSLSREEITPQIEAAGGLVVDFVLDELDYIVVGEKGDPRWKFNGHGRKLDDAFKKIAKGQKILILPEALFLKAWEQRPSFEEKDFFLTSRLNWYLDCSGKKYQYFLFDGDKNLLLQLLRLFNHEKLPLKGANHSFRPAENGTSYQWFLKLETNLTKEELLPEIEKTIAKISTKMSFFKRFRCWLSTLFSSNK